jgi:fermentation-respiration switch protein FrsA (DUF1100 family)
LVLRRPSIVITAAILILLGVALLRGGGAVVLGPLRAALAAIEDTFIYYPSRPLIATPAARGLRFEEVTLHAADGVRLHGWFVPGPRRLVWLWLHGNAGNISHRVENIALVHQRLGVGVFIFDYRGYGQSAGQPSEDGLYRDADAALAYLRGRPDVEPGCVVLFGRSLGANIAAALAAREDVRGVILESPFSSVPGLARALYPMLPLDSVLRSRYDAREKIARVRAPVLVIASRDDAVIPYREAELVFAAAPEPKRLVTLRGAGHNDTYRRGGEAYWQALAAFLDERERAAGGACGGA